MIHFQLPPPTAASRVRHHGKHHWHAPAYAAWLSQARWLASLVAPIPMTGPICLAAVVVCERPQWRPKWASASAWRTGLRVWRPVKPDDDNFGKAIRDAMNGRAFVDDGQIVASLAYKVAAAKGESPKILVWVGPVEERMRIFDECMACLGASLGGHCHAH